MSKKEEERFEICEMFMAKADKDRCFFGIINRFEDHDGNPAVFCKIVMLMMVIYVLSQLIRKLLVITLMRCV
jgi:hypothetical protein